MHFTDKLIKNLKPKNTRYDLREKSGNGFVIRVTSNGHKSWVFFYNFEGRKYRLTLGTYPAISLADGRELHRKAVKCLASGKNPATEQQKTKAEARTADTINDLIQEYLEKWAKPRKRSWEEDERMLIKDVTSCLGKQKAKDITRRDIVTLLDRVLERGSPIAANRTLAVIRRMFNFAVERDVVPFSPCHGLKAPAKENKKDRVLSKNEIHTFWQALDDATMSELSRLALKLQLVTAQRKGEIVSTMWEELDLAEGFWTIPAHKAKNSILHRVPLSKFAIELLEKIKEISSNSKWLFPSFTSNADRSMTPEAVDHAIRKNEDVFKIKYFTPHDLRRTAASHMTALGVSRLVVSKILNHVENSVTAIYDRHSYDKEKKQAMEMWGKKLKEIIKNTL